MLIVLLTEMRVQRERSGAKYVISHGHKSTAVNRPRASTAPDGMQCTYEVFSRSTGLVSNRIVKSMDSQNILTLLMRSVTLSSERVSRLKR
jgi:hypothetical protein